MQESSSSKEPDSTTKDAPSPTSENLLQQYLPSSSTLLVPTTTTAVTTKTPIVIGTLLVLSKPLPPLPSFESRAAKSLSEDDIDPSKSSTSAIALEPAVNPAAIPSPPLPSNNSKKYFLRTSAPVIETETNELKQRLVELADVEGNEDTEDLLEKLQFHKLQPDGSYNCELCDEVKDKTKKKKRFSTKPEVVRHLLRAHSRCSEFECSSCPNTFQLRESLVNHVEIEHSQQQQPKNQLVKQEVKEEPQPQPLVSYFECAKCEYRSQDERLLRLHVLRKHAKLFGYVCSCCAKCFRTWLAKNEHEKAKQQQDSRAEEQHSCGSCDGRFGNRKLLVKHLHDVHNVVLLLDAASKDEGAPSSSSLLHSCECCARTFVSEKSLRAHEAGFHAKRRGSSKNRCQYNDTLGYPCEVCGKFLSSKDHLKKHGRVHSGERPYSCPECGKAFALVMTMKIHALSHSGIKPYVCRICKLKYSQRSALMIHWKSKHKGLPAPPPIEIHHYFDEYGNVLPPLRRRSY